MSAPGPIEEAAALLDQFARSGWASMHVRGRAIELFVARDAGQPNPMASAGEAAPGAAAAETAILSAPHLGTLGDLAPVGTTLAAGDRYGGIMLLDETIDLVADRAGEVRRHAAAAGELIEFDQPLIALG